jgi:glycosyltransferase involved in cell wall biosynthesis
MFANCDAIGHLLHDIWPHVLRMLPEAQLILIGKNGDEDAERFGNHPRVSVLGYVEDIRDQMREASCVVVPIRVGGGTRLKILDAWGMGKPVVSTSVGCEGLSAVDGVNILIRDNPMEFAEAVVNISRDPDLRKWLGSNARRTAESEYSWDVVGRQLCQAYHDLLGDTKQSSARLAYSENRNAMWSISHDNA